MNIYRPKWVKKYAEIGFEQEWADDIIEKHGEDLPKQLSNKFTIENYYKINPLNLENESKILSKINIPKGYTLSEVLLFILDCLNNFGKNIPDSDSEIYKLYTKMTEHEEIQINIDFEEFYVFARRMKYTDITQTSSYKTLEQTVKYYTLNTVPLEGSVWTVPYKNGTVEIKVLDTNKNGATRIYDSNIYVKIQNIIEPIDVKYLEKGMSINLRPYAFNNGIQNNPS